METVSVSDLIDAGVHFGCPAARWNPKMEPYIYGRRNLIHIIDLRETLKGIIRAQNVLYHMAVDGSSVLWVGTKRQVKGVIAEAGERTGMPIVTERWIGGTLTNFSVIRSRLRRLEELERMEEDGSLSQYSKRMIASLRRERRKIERNLGGIREMSSMPEAMVVVDSAREYNAVREARKMGLVVIGLLDTDCDPSQVDIVIPGNDDALKSVRLLVEQLAEAVEEGCANQREQLAAMGVAEKRDDAGPAPGVPRPTRTIRPIPPLVRSEREREGESEEELTADETAGRPQDPEDEQEKNDDDGEELVGAGVRRGSGRFSQSTIVPRSKTPTRTSIGANFSFDPRISPSERQAFFDRLESIAARDGIYFRQTSRLP